ncbi:MAG: FmdB family transcriptional regulator [Coriobacteriia bacterium]|nr:FmdB family transcriptional regulator [Coriobacteriia bacterium]
MPAYDYRCTECEQVFEVRHAAGEQLSVDCPSCSARAKRVFSPFGVVFKGSGFHNTDYRAKPSDEKPSPDKPREAAPCSKKDSDSSACSNCPAAE